MGTIFTLEDSVRTIITSALDDLISELGKMCRLVYPPRMIRCPNCVFDPVGKKSTNRYLSGGPMPFQNMACPICNGTGQRAESVTDDVKFLCAFDTKSFFVPIPDVDIQTPFSYVQTKGFIATQLAKVKRADHMVFQTALEGVLNKKYKLHKDPADVANIIQNRYFVATWKQVQ